jgi:hypothetical protein
MRKHEDNALLFIERLRQVYQDKGYAFFDKGDYNLNIVGIRNMTTGKADKFDDWICLVYKINDKWVVDTFPATTEPGTSILKKPIVKGGTAILIPGQYRGVYKIGTHGGKRRYTALCQRLGKVKIWRDDNRDRTPDYEGAVHEGMYGINIHRQWGPDDREYTGGVSAGCQVFRSSKDFYQFMEICHVSAEMYSNSFTYTLINDKDIEKTLDMCI